MSKYEIQQKIKTLAVIEGDFSDPQNIKAEISIDDLIFKQWDCTEEDGPVGDAWIVQTCIEAENAKKAYSIFSKKLEELLPKICFVSQCFLNFRLESFLILKKNDNVDNSFIFVRYNNEKGTGLYFEKNQKDAVEKLKEYPHPQVFKFLQESINTSNYYARLALLFAALEAMSGEVEKISCACLGGKKYKTYNRDEMKKILNDDTLYNELFGEKKGLRHQLFHGQLIDFEIQSDYFSKIYKAIIQYFNEKYFIKIGEEALNIPRHFDSKNIMELFLKTDKKEEIKLQKIVQTFTRDSYGSFYKEREFEVINNIWGY